MNSRKLWLWLAAIFLASFAVLGWLGRDIFMQAPPVPERVVAADGSTVYTRAQIQAGREVWQSLGGMEMGTVWGHGSYVAPDWSADWLHREATALLDHWAGEKGASYAALPAEDQAALRQRLLGELRPNTYDARSGVLSVSRDRAQAMAAVADHYARLFSGDPALHKLRVDYAIPEKTLTDPADGAELGAFFFWTAWASVTDRPHGTVSYTNNWPHDPLVGNVPSAAIGIWSVASFLFLIAGVGWLVWYQARSGEEPGPQAPASDPLLHLQPTPSMKATTKYFVTVIGLFLTQVMLGAITAHYAVEGQDFYGIPISDIIPYALTRTWHTQLAVFWIATAWLATGLYVAPMLSGHEPRFQRLGVNVLWVALLVVVIGSFAGEWLGVQQKLGHGAVNFWFGHMGYEYVDLGRFWAILLFAGLMIWLALVGRALWPALRTPSESRGLIGMVFISTICIGLFFGAALTWGRHSSLSMIEYFRWWVVHLWVEGFFEVFATAVIALIFSGLGLVRARAANTAVVFSTAVFLTGGILGTLHHLYFSGTTTPVVAWGAMFSALEVVPLALLGVEAFHNYRLTSAAPWVQTYKWPILFFVAVSFWNLVGAGVLGFAINPPISLYYVQGLNLTPSHGHAALFGVYGMLGIGLMLFCLRTAFRTAAWSDAMLKPTFWALNLGLGMMVFGSLVPTGIYQAYQSVTHGFWYARSPEVVHGRVMETLVWMRVPGDVLFSLGAVILALFMARLLLGARERTAKWTQPDLLPAE